MPQEAGLTQNGIYALKGVSPVSWLRARQHLETERTSPGSPPRYHRSRLLSCLLNDSIGQRPSGIVPGDEPPFRSHTPETFFLLPSPFFFRAAGLSLLKKLPVGPAQVLFIERHGHFLEAPFSSASLSSRGFSHRVIQRGFHRDPPARLFHIFGSPPSDPIPRHYLVVQEENCFSPISHNQLLSWIVERSSPFARRTSQRTIPRASPPKLLLVLEPCRLSSR